jgi:CubicO group peptidase (beta-lactamase class C family)
MQMLSLLAVAAYAQKMTEGAVKPAQSITELRQQLETILRDSHTPGLSVAIVRRSGPEWVAGLGKSNVAANRAATDETLFRIGSISKAFVSLSILKLVNEGKLSLQDPVHRLVPEVWFENPWEATDPVRVVDLLEHTTGWDDMHLRESVKDAKGMTLREGLDYDHPSRISRWRPGTRMAYSNSGPPVAAYIVEKITGQRFEDYVTQNFFLPIGMKTATYFEQPSPPLTILYHRDGKTPCPYWNMALRPAGAINASAVDMAAFIQFFLSRGEVGGTQVMPPASIDRMETPTRTWEAQQGLKAGYGLSDVTSVHDGFVYHGHNGGVDGGLAEMAYLTEYGVGCFYSINAGNGGAFEKIGDTIRAYIERGLTRPVAPSPASLPADAPNYGGWYEPVSPRYEFTHYFERLAGLHSVWFEHGNMVFSNLIGTASETFVPVAGEHFRYLPKDGLAEPVATAELIAPNLEGRFVAIDGATWERVPTWLAAAEITVISWFWLAFYAILLYAPFWIFGGLIEKRRRPAERALRVWPLVAVLSLIVYLILWTSAGNNELGRLTVWSLGLFFSTLAFGGASVASAVSLWLARKRKIRRRVRWFSAAVTSALSIAAVYLAYWGIIGIRTWV